MDRMLFQNFAFGLKYSNEFQMFLRCRITIKKRLADCSVLGCRLVLILDDLLWVLTDDQVRDNEINRNLKFARKARKSFI
jgi:hypothetical protein